MKRLLIGFLLLTGGFQTPAAASEITVGMDVYTAVTVLKEEGAVEGGYQLDLSGLPEEDFLPRITIGLGFDTEALNLRRGVVLYDKANFQLDFRDGLLVSKDQQWTLPDGCTVFLSSNRSELLPCVMRVTGITLLHPGPHQPGKKRYFIASEEVERFVVPKRL